MSKRGRAARFDIEERAANTFIAESCLVYLLQFREQDCLDENFLDTYKLADYAADLWTVHAQKAKEDTKLMYQLIRELFTLTYSAYLNWHHIQYLTHQIHFFNNVGRCPNSILLRMLDWLD